MYIVGIDLLTIYYGVESLESNILSLVYIIFLTCSDVFLVVILMV